MKDSILKDIPVMAVCQWFWGLSMYKYFTTAGVYIENQSPNLSDHIVEDKELFLEFCEICNIIILIRTY